MAVCPDVLEAELKARQKRQRAARFAALKRRAAKAPLLADQIIERELKERADYFSAEQTDEDRQRVIYRLEEKSAKAEGRNIDPSAILYDDPFDVEMSLRAIQYKATARHVLFGLDYWRACCKARHGFFGREYLSKKPEYKANYWRHVVSPYLGGPTTEEGSGPTTKQMSFDVFA